MSIQRYECLGIIDECNNGDHVFYADHLTDKQAALDAQQAAHADEVERLTGERDELNDYFTGLVNSLCASAGRILGDDCYIESPVEHVVNIEDKFREVDAARDAAVRERDVAVEAIRKSLLINDTPHEEARYYRIIRILRAALAKIEGERNA